MFLLEKQQTFQPPKKAKLLPQCLRCMIQYDTIRLCKYVQSEKYTVSTTYSNTNSIKTYIAMHSASHIQIPQSPPVFTRTFFCLASFQHPTCRQGWNPSLPTGKLHNLQPVKGLLCNYTAECWVSYITSWYSWHEDVSCGLDLGLDMRWTWLVCKKSRTHNSIQF